MVTLNKNVASLLKDQKVKNYSFSIGFFIVFSIFIYFAIRPNLVTAFNLQKELQDLKLTNREYEEKILQIVNYQTTIEENRDKFGLLDEAIPQSPSIVKVVEDIKKSASDSGILLDALAVDSLEYDQEKRTGSEVYTFNITTSGKIEFSQLNTFLSSIINQRRIKTIESINISQGQFDEETLVTKYLITLSIRGHYL